MRDFASAMLHVPRWGANVLIGLTHPMPHLIPFTSSDDCANAGVLRRNNIAAKDKRSMTAPLLHGTPVHGALLAWRNRGMRELKSSTPWSSHQILKRGGALEKDIKSSIAGCLMPGTFLVGAIIAAHSKPSAAASLSPRITIIAPRASP
jgi:hypothetical protein